jgi:uncharacterized protein (TIGR02996 family)
MTDDQAFVDTILANPNDETPRLVYADWLEERGDPRGEFLRLDSTMIAMRIGTPRYEQARNRLVELRKDIDSKWARCVGFRPITSIETLIQFLREFHRHWMDDPVLDAAAIPLDLPYGLMSLYRELGALFEFRRGRGPFNTQDSLSSPSQLQEIGGMVAFASENQGNWSCRYVKQSVDPPVYTDSNNEGEFAKVCDSLIHFLTTICLQEAVMSAPCLLSLEGSLEDCFGATLTPIWLGGRFAYEQPSNFYALPRHDALVLN